MRRFSQRNSLVTLNEINITPLLDLAFVLLIIFVITRPLLEQSLPLQLPQGGGPDQKLEAKDIRTVEVSLKGTYRLGGREMPMAEIVNMLVRATQSNPKTVVYIRTDENGLFKYTFAIIDRCQKRGITKFGIRSASIAR